MRFGGVNTSEPLVDDGVVTIPVEVDFVEVSLDRLHPVPLSAQPFSFDVFARHVDGGNVKMQADDVLKLLEKHEEECNRRYAHIQNQLDKLDIRLWGIAALIIAAAVAERFI